MTDSLLTVVPTIAFSVALLLFYLWLSKGASH